ncbi:MAG: tRNA pseudouridine(55) synthase TruB [Candidatus Omnitrophica bacterium]|nr:tRNA pseudouridine(55) synthase TruB [Candidatus Omnitrophota bacterium]
MNGILNVDKPTGLTSHDVVDLIRKAARIRKVGHAGTLDPIATGVLPLCLGNATKLSEFLMAEEKEYSLICTLGVVTDSQDITGDILEKNSAESVSLDQVQEILDRFRGTIEQIPPMLSAKRHQGKRLYDLARQGIEVEREPVQVEIHRLDLVRFENPEIELAVACSKGTYMRTLCHDIGAALGCGGVLSRLVRTRCGALRVEDSVDVGLLKDPDSVREHLLSPDVALDKFAAVVIQDSEVGSWLTGRAIRGGAILSRTQDFEKESILRIKSRDGRLVGLAKSLFTSDQVDRLGGDLEVLKPVRVFPKPF